MKAKFLLFGLVFSILLAIPLILAYNYNIDVDSNYSVFNIEVYKCNDDSCSVITFHDSSTSGEYSLVGSGDNYYAEYDYKSCFRPHIYRMHVWGDLSGDEDYDILFDKKEDCEADINDGDLSEYEIDLGESVLITSNIHSGFEYPNGIPETTAIPIGIEDEYSTNTKVSFYANDIKIYETDKEILLASDEDFEFDWTPTSAGVYEIKVKSEVIDCACSSENTQTEIIGELIVNEPAECSIDSDCADDYYEDNYCFEDDSYRYFHDFSCVNESCFEDIINELVEECDYDCVDGECIDEPPECCDDEDCSDDEYSSNYCDNDDVYNDFTDWFCDDGDCNSNFFSYLVEDCGEDEYGEWNYYCEVDDLYKDRYYSNKGCNGGACFIGTVTQTELVEECDYGCVDGECIDEPPECCDDGDCPDDEYSDNYCYNENLYKDFIDWFCDDGDCNYNIFPELVEDCGEDEYGEWNYYCDADDARKSRYYAQPGCNNNGCFIGTVIQDELVEECDYDCVDGECIDEPPECTLDSECSDDYYEDNYCFEDDSYRYFHDFSCVNESCFEDIINELVEECDYDCVDGECIDEPPECCDDDDCSDDYYGDNYCVDDDVYRKFYDYGCEDGECEKDTTTELVEECAYSCDDGECEDEPDDDDNTWCIETNLCEVEFDQSDVMPIMLSDDGNGQSYSMMLTRDGGEGEEDKEDGKSNDYFWIIALIIAIIIILIIIILLQVI